MRFVVASFMLLIVVSLKTYAQQDSSALKSNDTSSLSRPKGGHLPFLDSVAMAMQQHDQFVQDSLATQYIRPADSLRHNQFIDTLLKIICTPGAIFWIYIPGQKAF